MARKYAVIPSLLLLFNGTFLFHSTTLGATPFRRGDANQDGRTDLSDSIAIFTYLFLGGDAHLRSCKDAGDVNDDGTLDISDGVSLLSFLYLGGSRPKPPFDDCGIDTTPGRGNTMGCESYTGCSAAPRVNENVKVIKQPRDKPGDPLLLLLYVEEETVSLRDPPGDMDISTGDVIVGLIPENLPAFSYSKGYMLKLTRLINTDGDVKVFSTSRARIDDVFTNLSFTLTIGADGATIETFNSGGNGGIHSSPIPGGGGSIPLNYSYNKDNYVLHDGPIPIINQGHLLAKFKQAHLSFTASVTAEYHDTIGIPDTLGLSADLALESAVELLLDATLGFSYRPPEYTFDVIHQPFCTAILGVPVCFNLDIIMKLGVSADAGYPLTVDIGGQADLTGTLGARWRLGLGVENLTTFSNPSFVPVPNPPSFVFSNAMHGTVKAWIRPELQLSVGVGIAPAKLISRGGLSVDAYMQGTVDLTLNPLPPCISWSIGPGVELTVTEDTSIFGVPISSVGPVTLYKQDCPDQPDWCLSQGGPLCEDPIQLLVFSNDQRNLGGGSYYTNWRRNIFNYSWDLFSPAARPQPDLLLTADSAGANGDLFAIVVGSDITLNDSMWLSVKRKDAPWGPYLSVPRAKSGPGCFLCPVEIPRVRDVGCAMINGSLNVVAVGIDGSLWHNMLSQGGLWQGWDDIKATAGNAGAFKNVDCASVNGELHVAAIAMTGAQTSLWHAIRRSSGWSSFADVTLATGGSPGALTQASIASVNGELHLCALDTAGKLWHTTRSTNGAWQAFTDVMAATASSEFFNFIDTTELNGEFHVVGLSDRVWHTIRHSSSWDPFFDVGLPAGHSPGSLGALCVSSGH